jgi:hypothetical protein
MTNTLLFLPAEETTLDIALLWAIMPDNDKKNYNNDIDLYARYKIAQAIKDEAFTIIEFKR